MKLMFKLILLSLISTSAWAAIPRANSNAFPEGEKLVFAKLLESYKKNDLQDVIKQKKLLESHYPQSAYMPSALYYIGSLEFQQNQFGEALRAFDQVIDRFSVSRKRVSALYGMGMTYKKLNLHQQADAVFHRIIDQYPGSPESQRAWLELRLSANRPKTEPKAE
jgi:TolA-binding protein